MTYLESLPEEAQAEWRRAMQYLLLLIQNKREPQEQVSLRDVVLASSARKHQEEVRTMAITASQAFEANGRVEKAEEIVLNQLQKRLGEVSASLQDLIQRLPEQQLSVLTLDLLDFVSVVDAESWIGARSSN